jgi:hypothetical protein
MATRTNAKRNSNVKTVPFSKVKVDYIAHRNVKAGTEEAHNAFKSMRQFIRSNKVKLVKAGWTELNSHEKGAPYGNVPVNVANIIVKRDKAALK